MPQPFANQLGNPPGQRKVRIHRAVPRLAAEGVVQLNGHVHYCTFARLHDCVNDAQSDFESREAAKFGFLAR